MYRNIVVPLDGSVFSEHALPLALTIARQAKAKLQLVHVHPRVVTVYGEGVIEVDDALEEHARGQMQLYLNRVAQRLREVGGVPVTTRILLGSVTEGIEVAAKDDAADLVVLTTHGRGTLGRFWLGSVADELVRHLTIPVLLIRPEEGKPDLTRPVSLKRMVIALDGTPLAEKMLQPAMEMGRLLGTEFMLLRVVEPTHPDDFPMMAGAISPLASGIRERIEKIHKRRTEEAETYLNDVALLFRERALKVRTKVLLNPQPAGCILAEGNHQGQDMLALETHGRSGLKRLLLGSVTDKVIRGAHVPVLVNRPIKE